MDKQSLPGNQFERVRTYREEVSYPYYRPGESDTLPPLDPRYNPRSRRVYPYALRELTGSECATVSFSAWILENRYLKLTVLPELGGRLVSAYDKVSEHDLLFSNPVLKPVMTGLTGAWCGTGVEFNFPGSHSVTSDLPVFVKGEMHPDGSGSLLICDREMLSGMRWCVRLTLRPDSEVIYQDSEFCNRTAMPHPAYWWNNAKVPAFPDTEFIFPRCLCGVIHPPMDITRITKLNLPYVNQIDLSHYRNVFFQLPLFFRSLSSRSFGVYHREHGFGLLHHADCGTLPGRKIWTLGNGDDGKVTTENLTEDCSPNIELQAGPLPIQTDFFLLRPGESHHWQEAWLPVRNMQAEHLASNHDFTLSHGPDGLMIQCHAQMAAVTVKTADDGISQVIEPKPGRQFMLPTAGTNVQIVEQASNFTLLDTAEKHVAETREQAVPVNLFDDAEEKVLWGLYREENGQPEEAQAFYQQALAQEPGNVRALNALGRHALRAKKPASASDLLNLALTKNRRNAESAYYYGLAEVTQGHDQRGAFFLERARFDANWRPAAEAALGRLFLRERRKTELDELLATAAESEELLELDIIYRRLTHRDNRTQIQQLRKLAPENPLSDYESGSMMTINDTMKLALLAGFYLTLQLPEDAIRLAGDVSNGNPLLDYIAGRIDEAEKHPLGGVFPPAALESTLALLTERHPQLPRLRYYHGLTLAAEDNWTEAELEWQKALQLECHEPELLRNLALCRQRQGKLRQAAELYARGFAPDAVNYKYVMEYDRVLAKLDDTAVREKIFASLPPGLLENPYIIVHRASLAAAKQQWHQVLELLAGHRFVLCEGKRMTGALFIQANCALAAEASENQQWAKAVDFYQAALSYPHGLGVGRSTGRFDMKTKYLLVKALLAAGKPDDARRKCEAYLEECRRQAIDFDPLATIRRECGAPCADPLLEENADYHDKLRALHDKIAQDAAEMKI